MNVADRKYRPAPDVHSRTFDGELVLVDLARGDYFGLNELGARLWQGIAAGVTPREVVDSILDFDVERERLLADIIALVTELTHRGLVVPVE